MKPEDTYLGRPIDLRWHGQDDAKRIAVEIVNFCRQKGYILDREVMAEVENLNRDIE